MSYQMSPQELESLIEYSAEKAAKVAAKEVIAEGARMLGIDMDDADSLRSFQRDLIYLRKRREVEESMAPMLRLVIWTTLGAAIVGGIGWLLSHINLHALATLSQLPPNHS